MKICAIICEYNPFHTGHLYQLTQANKKFDETICIMSGNFVQRAEPAVLEKHVRAKVAINCGASMVIELPTPYAVSNGERFASGAIRTLSRLKDIDYLVMGCETADTKTLLTLAEIQSNESNTFKTILAEKLDEGLSYASAITYATSVCAKEKGVFEDDTYEILSKPNNLLCIEYIKAINANSLSIKPHLIQRQGNDYNSISTSGNYLSATAIREMIKNGDYTGASIFMPERDITLEELRNYPVDFELYSAIALLNLKGKTVSELSSLYDCREGIEYKLLENAQNFSLLEKVLQNCKSKRYTMSRLKRMALHLLLGIDKELLSTSEYLPPRLLGIKENFKHYLADNGKNLIIRSEDIEKYIGQIYEKFFSVEKRSADIYSILTKKDENLFPPKKLYTI